MKNLIATLCLIVSTAALMAQGTVKGRLIDAETSEGLISATIYLQGSTNGTITDFDGYFVLKNLPEGEQMLVISYIGYEKTEKSVLVASGKEVDLGDIEVAPSSVGLEEVKVVASLARDRQTPIAVTTIKGDLIEAQTGNQEFPEIMRHAPSIYVTKQGGGFGDSRINVRGFDQRNVAVMLNGVPVNDMENGWVYWSNWAGLSDVASSIQIQRGLGASKLAVPSVGGSINIITNPADRKFGGNVSVGFGNDLYQKYGLTLSSGQFGKGWAITARGTYTRGNGYVNGTQFEGGSYFLAISKELGEKHTLILTGLGAPQWHHQRLVNQFDGVTLQTFEDNGIKYNHLYGQYNGKEFSWRRNFYHKPKVFLNHYWNISSQTNLKTSAYASWGRGGGTGPRGRINTASSRIYDGSSKIRDENGQVRFDDLAAWNGGAAVDTATWGLKEPETSGDFAGQYITTSSGNGFVRRASMNEHDWYGIISTLTHRFNENMTLTGGVDGRYYIGRHYRKLDNLLGNDAYLSRANTNNPSNYITDPNQRWQDGNILGYNNDGVVSWVGLFGQFEYTSEKLSAFVTASGSNQGFQRIDYFSYDMDTADYKSDWQNFLGGVVKGGVNYNINQNHNVFANVGYISRQPIFDNVFMNFRNDVNPDIKNQNIFAVELGYGLRMKWISANLNLYHTYWGNRQFDRSLEVQALNLTSGQTETVDALATFSNVGQLHQGIEVDFEVRPVRKLSINGMLSLGNWRYTQNFVANTAITDNANNFELTPANQQDTLYVKGLRVGDAAQTTFSIGASYEIIKGLKVYAKYWHGFDLYADFDITDNRFFSEGASVVKLPNYGLLDGGLSYRHDFKKTYFVVGGNVNNILNTKYIAELDTNIEDDPSTTDTNEFYNNRGFYGFGTTWNVYVKFGF